MSNYPPRHRPFPRYADWLAADPWFGRTELALLPMRRQCSPYWIAALIEWAIRRHPRWEHWRILESLDMVLHRWMDLLGYRRRGYGQGMGEPECTWLLTYHDERTIWGWLVRRFIRETLVLLREERRHYDRITTLFSEPHAVYNIGKVGYSEERLRNIRAVASEEFKDRLLRWELERAGMPMKEPAPALPGGPAGEDAKGGE